MLVLLTKRLKLKVAKTQNILKVFALFHVVNDYQLSVA